MRRRAALSIVVLAMTVVACGGDGKPSGSPIPLPSGSARPSGGGVNQSPGLIGTHSYTSPDNSGYRSVRPSLTLSGTGAPVVSYHLPAPGKLMVLRCGNANCSSGNSSATIRTMLADRTGPPIRSSVALDGDMPVVAFSYVNEPYVRHLGIARCGTNTCAPSDTITTARPDQSYKRPAPISMALDAQGFPVVAYIGTERQLKILRCGNKACNSGNIIREINPERDAWGVSLRLDGDIPVVSFVDDTKDGEWTDPTMLKVLRCGNATCSSGNMIASFPASPTDLAPTYDGYREPGDVNTSLVLDSRGFPVVVYDMTQNRVGVLRCGNKTCTSSNSLATVVEHKAYGFSLSLDASGFPVVAFSRNVENRPQDRTLPSSGQIAVLRCGDARCQSGNRTEEPLDVSISTPVGVLDAGGKPIIALTTSETSDNLRILHCANVTCQPAGLR